MPDARYSILDTRRSEAEIPFSGNARYSMLDGRYSMLDAGQIMDDLVPISRLSEIPLGEGGIFYREYSMLDVW
jgi:hypothetical protein